VAAKQILNSSFMSGGDSGDIVIKYTTEHLPESKSR